MPRIVISRRLAARAGAALLAGWLVALLPSLAAAQEWTRFRGPNGTGLSDAATIPTTWTDKDYNWRVKLPGIGHSSPVVWGNKLFITSADETTAERIVLCLDTAQGQILWQRRFPSTAHHKHLRNSFASSTPAVDAERVYLTWTTPESYLLMALDHSGADVWKRDLGPFVSQHSGGASPIVVGDLVVVNNDQDGPSFITAVRAKDGSTAWQTPRKTDRVAYSTPCLRELPGGGQELIFASQSHGLCGVDPQTGKTNWELAVFSKRTVASPLVAGGLVFCSCGSGGGGNYVVAVKPGPEPKEVYRLTETAPYVPTLVAKGDLLFAWSDKGVVTCLDLATGQPHWRERVGRDCSGSPVCVGNRVYCIAEDGTVIVLAAEKQFKILAEVPLGEDSRATPCVAGGVMYLRTYSQLFSLGGKPTRSAE